MFGGEQGRMNPTQAWSLLTTRSPSMDRISAGYLSMKPADVAALLAGLYREAFLMGMAHFCADYRSLTDLERNLWVRVQDMANSGNWEFAHGFLGCRRLAGLALFETIDDLTCQTCSGKGTTTFVLTEEPSLIFSPYYELLNAYEGRIRCMSCWGAGRLRLSGRKRADLAGIGKDAWSRTWAKRYEPVYQLTQRWLGDANTHLAKQLRAA